MEKVKVCELIKKDISGKIICFPTDTVYGVGALVDDLAAINKIFQMKNRDISKPLAILTGTKDINKYVKNLSCEAINLIDEGWPGALTLIFQKSENIDDAITKGFNTIAFRMPDSNISLQILNHFGLMAVTSVNVSGQKELTNIDEIEKSFGDWIDYLVIDSEIFSKKPSKVVDLSSGYAKTIRS